MEELVGEGELCSLSRDAKDLMPVTIQFALGRHSVNCWLLGGRLQHTVVSVLKSKILPLCFSAPSLGPGELVQGLGWPCPGNSHSAYLGLVKRHQTSRPPAPGICTSRHCS